MQAGGGFGPPVCVQRRNNATLAVARLVLAPQPKRAACPVRVPSCGAFFGRTIA